MLKTGKSTLFYGLTGRKKHMLRIPRSRIELPAGSIESGSIRHIVDAPGFYSLAERSEDALAVRELVLLRRIGAVLLVIDSKNMRRGLMLAMQLAEFSVPVVVALNMVDEALQRGIRVDATRLSRLLGVPVVPTVAAEGRGLGALKRAIAQAAPLAVRSVYPKEIETQINAIAAEIGEGQLARGLAALLLGGLPLRDRAFEDLGGQASERIRSRLQGLAALTRSGELAVVDAWRERAESIVAEVTELKPVETNPWSRRLAVWTRRPATGLPIALGVLMLVYLFVGLFGAGVLVDLIEGRLFGGLFLPWLDGLVAGIPWLWLRELINGPFGIVSVGLVLSIGIVAPVLATFFWAFALLEDSGYLPRLSLLLDRSMRRIGLNGKGVLPLVMGFSCVTMAVLTTRMLDTPKQRIISTLLLMLAIPCAPLLSVMLVVLARLSAWAAPLLLAMLALQFVLVGLLANLLLPGKRPTFLLELPPLRIPRMRNTFIKTGHHLWWFLKEAIPYFMLGTLVLYAMDQLDWLDGIREAARPVLVRFLDLPPESADVFLLTAIRREAGAALLAQQSEMHLYDGVQVLVTLLVMTLMIPCINSVLVMYKERGALVATSILLFVIAYSLGVGAVFNALLRTTGVAL